MTVPPAESCNILVLNSGSSSIKFAVIDVRLGIHRAHGSLEYLSDGFVRVRFQSDPEMPRVEALEALPDINTRLARLFTLIKTLPPRHRILAVGHRVVHGGEAFHTATLVTPTVQQKLQGLSHLAPLHNPINLSGIQHASKAFPDLPQVAIFDTGFFHDLPEHAWRYAVPERWYREFGVRRYGFHGISHDYVTHKAAELIGKPYEKCRMLSLHLGNGASISALRDGRCIDTSMGMTPLAGLVMGTRSGDLDPAVPLYMQEVAQLSAHEVSHELNHYSGLYGLCGSADMRNVLHRAANADAQASQAIAIYVHHIRHYIGAYFAATGPLDALIFTGGIGENAPEIRRRICADLDHMGIHCQDEYNLHDFDDHARLSPGHENTAVLVIRTQEDLAVARQTAALIGLPLL